MLAQKSIMVSYTLFTQGYHVWLIDSHKTIESSNVMFKKEGSEPILHPIKTKGSPPHDSVFDPDDDFENGGVSVHPGSELKSIPDEVAKAPNSWADRDQFLGSAEDRKS